MDEQKLKTLQSEILNIDFGVIQEPTLQTKILYFKNSFNNPILLHKSTSTCGCTTATLSKDQIKPSENTMLTISFNPLKREGKQKQSIKITGEIEGINASFEFNIDVFGDIRKEIKVTPSIVLFEIEPSIHNDTSIIVELLNDRPFKINQVLLPEGYSISKKKGDNIVSGDNIMIIRKEGLNIRTNLEPIKIMSNTNTIIIIVAEIKKNYIESLVSGC